MHPHLNKIGAEGKLQRRSGIAAIWLRLVAGIKPADGGLAFAIGNILRVFLNRTGVQSGKGSGQICSLRHLVAESRCNFLCRHMYGRAAGRSRHRTARDIAGRQVRIAHLHGDRADRQVKRVGCDLLHQAITLPAPALYPGVPGRLRLPASWRGFSRGRRRASIPKSSARFHLCYLGKFCQCRQRGASHTRIGAA